MDFRILKKVLFYSLIVLCVASCKKDSDQFIPFEVDLDGTREDIFNAFAGTTPSSEFQVNADNYIFVQTDRGTRLEADAGSFQFEDGTVATGDIRIEILELYSKGAILMQGIQTLTNDGQILESDGELRIRAFQGNDELELIPGKRINLKVPNATPRAEMELFYGDQVIDPAGEEVDVWREADGDRNSTNNVWESEWQDSTGFGFGYECFSDSLQWVNIDYFTKFDDTLTMACVDLPNGYDVTNTAVFAVFKDINVVLQLGGNSDLEMFCAQLPVGEDVEFIVLAAADTDIFHFAKEDATITNNLIKVMTPEETPIDDIKAYLMSL